MPALVQVGKDHSGIVFEGIEHAVAMMRIDVDVGDAGHAAIAQQMLDHHAAIVEDTEPGGARARGVMQPADRHEGAAMRAIQDPLGRRETRADDALRRLEDAAESRRVTAVEPAVARLRALHDEANVLGSVKQLQFADQRIARLEHLHARLEAALLEFAHEGAVPVGSERVTLGEAVTGQPFAEHDSNFRASGVQRVPLSSSLGQLNEGQR